MFHIQPDKKLELIALFCEFTSASAFSSEAQTHVDLLDRRQAEARESFHEIDSAADQGQDVTERVLLMMVPQTGLDAHSIKETWVFFALGCKQKDGVPHPNQNPAELVNVILHFLRFCNEQPENLAFACAEVAKTPYQKDLHAGVLSPVLNALRPCDFLPITSNSLRFINYFSDKSWSLNLADYPAVNAAGRGLVEELDEEIRRNESWEMRKVDVFLTFLNWLIVKKKYGLNARFLLHPEMYKNWPPMW